MLAVLASGTALHAANKVVCGAAFATQFNLEPAANAVPQQFESVDFIPNGIGLNQDLIVGGAFDFRGGSAIMPAPAGVVWDGSLSGYYVHRSTVADCGAQFEGGLPPLVSKGSTFGGNGGVAIAADPTRNAFFAADQRFDGVHGVFAIGLMRASAGTLKNTTLCPNGTHTLAQAKSCWAATPGVVLDPGSTGNVSATLDFPTIAVDERATGVGAGNVYVAFQNFAAGITLVACTNGTLACSAPATISASGEPVAVLGTGNADVQVRPDGDITVTYLDMTTVPVESVMFVLCKPAGAPKAPVCSAPATVATENQALGAGITASTLSGLNVPVFTAARHADRLESDGKTFTTFVVWDRCGTYFMAPGGGLFPTCLKSEVLMSASSDGGKTWSAPVAVSAKAGHQFLPGISTDASTGTVNIAYFNTALDVSHKRVVVTLNQIAAGSVTVGPEVFITGSIEAADAAPTLNPIANGYTDFHFGIKARGMGTAGFSRVYTSFTTSADRQGSYAGVPLPEQNNNLQKVTY